MTARAAFMSDTIGQFAAATRISTVIAAADFSLLKRAEHVASVRGIHAKVGSILTSDHFYYDDPDFWKLWAGYGVLAIEMETAARRKRGVEEGT